MFGDRGVVTPAVALDLQRLNPRLQTVQIQGAGHSVHMDQPVSFTKAVQSFIYSV